MPGHIKKTSGPDPDPSQWLYVSHELKEKLKAKPYDPKKSCWVPDKATGGFNEGTIESTEGEKVTVSAKGEKKVFKKDQVGQVNPPKFDCCVDMSNLTYLNDASVLWNLRIRYVNELIYTYSGLFCIAVNPYKRFPIYTQRSMEVYMGKRRNEVPPHIFAIAEGAFQGMMQGGKNQSILITGESGAGKTENTKKVISYFASIGATGKKKEGEPGLEDKIVQTNPVLEAWGNAKTVRNDNSSRFGKFIRIHFNQSGKLAGADMVVYLLEKSRLTYQQPLERCYHSFYNLMSDAVPSLKAKCLLSNDVRDYYYVSQGKIKVDSIDDKEDMQFADEAFDILGFTETEKFDVYKNTACMMHMGEMTKTFIGIGKEDQADIKDEDRKHANNVATLLGIDCEWMINYFCKPKLKVGVEWVTKGQTVSQAASSVAGIARSLYERSFKFVVEMCNNTLIDPTMKRVQFIGVLDIAGFEIFDFNGFEQICINFANEKLQQFFNHHMFVLEQEEYMREGIEWAMVDFGMDLQKCIEMFEKPMGLLAILEEESLFPKATDQSFAAKLHSNLLGKCPNFAKPDPKPDPNAHFAIAHYAAKVSYNITGWLEKNKDPLNDTIVEMMKNGTNALVVLAFLDHPGQPMEAPKDQGGAKKKGGGKTVSSFYKSQLEELMKTLMATEPHFIRCVVPNTHKQPGGVEPGLIMHQLTCNGVLEGIRICRKGFPNRMSYPDFKSRYNILAAAAVAKAKSDKAAAASVIDTVGLEKEKFRLGHTKVFFRAGVLGQMEETREDRVAQVLSWLQAYCRGKQARMSFKKMQDQKMALYCCQRTIRNYMIGKTWMWWQIWLALKPNLKCTKFAQYKAEYEEKIAIAEANIDSAVKDCNKVKGVHAQLATEKEEVLRALDSGGDVVKELSDKIDKLDKSKNDLAKQVDQTNARIRAEEDQRRSSEQTGGKIRKEMEKLKDDMKEIDCNIEKSEEDVVTKENQIRTLKEELAHQEELIQKLAREKKSAGESRQKTEEDIQANEDRCNHLTKVKLKLEQNLDECEDSLEREKKSRGDADKLKKKVESDLKLTQETVADLERIKEELNATIQRKEKELASASAKIEDEQTLGGKYSKQIKELQTRIEELDEELSIERQNRNKAEKNRATLSRDIEDLGEKLEDAGNNTATQIELNKKRETELFKLKTDMEESNIAFEGTLSSTRSKHNNVIAEMGASIDELNKSKAKAEADKAKLERDLHESKNALDAAIRDRQNIEKDGKLTQARIVEANQKLDEMARALNEADASKKKLTVEGQDLSRQIEDAETHINDLGKTKISLTTQLDDTKRLADAESRDRATLLSKFKNLNSELENLRERIEEESEQKAEILKQLSKAQAEIQLWRSRYETEGLGRIDELEGNKAKLQMRLQEAEETIDSLHNKVASTEKTKHRLDTELEDLQLEFERINAAAIVAEKRAENFDKVVGEWKLKVGDLGNELEASQRECRNFNSEVFRLRAGWEEINEQLDAVKRENKNLAEEIKDLLDQLGEGGRSIHELDKQRRRLEIEKEELQAALEEAEATLEQEENKVMRAQLELSQIRQEIDRRIQEKEEEFENTRKNHARALDSMQASLEAESRAKAEALRIKKKIETDINELEIALDHANKANAEAHKTIKRYQNQYRDVETAYEEECRQRQEIADKAGLADRRANALQGELEESRSLLDSAERGKKQAELELHDARVAVNDLTTLNGRAANDKRQLESAVHTLHAEIDSFLQSAKNSEEKAKKAMVDASRLADELRAEQDHCANQQKAKRALDAQVKELEVRLAEVVETATKGGKNAIAKLEGRIKELEMELGNCQMRTSETQKAYQKSERKIKELQFQNDEDQKNQEKMGELATKLQEKIRTYKKQIEEAEEIAALNLAKFRKAQQELEEAEERSRLAEDQIEGMRRVRGNSVFGF